jgi:uncharacterized protein YkwD
LASSLSSKKVRRSFLQLEELEIREVLSGVQPTAFEQVFLERLNDIRANPAAYGNSIGLDLSGVAAAQPLAFDPRLIEAARGHSQDMNNNRFFGHTSSDGKNAGQRISAAGFPWTSYGESIAAGFATAEATLQALIVDNGIPDLGHRRHLLAIDALFKNQNLVGVGILENGSGPYINYFTVDTASTADSRAALTGVIFNDANNNGKYDLNEGVGNLTLTIQGVGSATTFPTGGYTYLLSPGTYSVTFSGSGLQNPITKNVTVGSSNTRLNILTNLESQPAPAPVPLPALKDMTANQSWVYQMSRDVLRREPTGSELAQWSVFLDQGGSRDSLISTLVNSSDFNKVQISSWVKETGENILGRSLTQTEINNYTDQLIRGGSYAGIVYTFFGQAGFNQLSATDWVRQLSSKILDREMTGSELNSWANYVQNGGAGSAINIFLNCDEYYQKRMFRYVNEWAVEILGHSLSFDETNLWGAHLRFNSTPATLYASLVSRADYSLVDTTTPPAASTQEWVRLVTLDLLQQEPTATELTQWASYVEQGGSRDSLVSNIVNSPEFARVQIAGWVRDTGLAVLGRALNQAEINLYTDQIVAGGSHSMVVYTFMSQAGINQLSATDWVRQLSSKILGREMVGSELNTWAKFIQNGGNPLSAIDAFINCDEYAQKRMIQYVSQWVITILGQPLSTDETSLWGAYLRYGGTSAGFLAAMVRRAEYS